MDFVCTVEWSSGTKTAVLGKTILELHRVGYLLKSQVREISEEGKVFVHISAQTKGSETLKEVEKELHKLNGFGLINLQPGSSLTALITPLDAKSALQEIARTYPDIARTVKIFASSLSEGTRVAELHSLGAKVGASVYQRDFSLGSPLAMPAALNRELVPALKAFSPVKVSGNSVMLKACPFCAVEEGEAMSCAFVSGFIQGFLDKNPAAQITSVTQTSCGSTGNQSCAFSIQ